MNRTLTDLRSHLGPPERFHIDAEPARKRSAVIAAVRWRCGCRAAGPDFRRLDLAACAAHRAGSAERRPIRALPLIGTFLSR